MSILIKIDRNMRIEINHDNPNCLFCAIFAAGIAKTVCIHNFQVKNKNSL